MAKRALVIGSETFSRILDWEDRTTCVLFGDGAGAIVLAAEEGERRRASSRPGSTPTGGTTNCSMSTAESSTTGTVGKLRMKGKEVFRHAVDQSRRRARRDAGGCRPCGADEVDWVVPHQANKRILDATARKLGLVRPR